jgi:hypothetical protein
MGFLPNSKEPEFVYALANRDQRKYRISSQQPSFPRGHRLSLQLASAAVA